MKLSVPKDGSGVVFSKKFGERVSGIVCAAHAVPLLLKDVPVGSRALRLTLAGYEPWSRAVQVVAQQHTTIAAALQQSR